MLRAIAGIVGMGGGTNTAIEIPTIRDDGSPRRTGRPKIHADRPKVREKDRKYLQNRHKLLPIFLKQVWSVPKTKPTRTAQREQRIIDITARRFGTIEGKQFPLQAIILMADKGVKEARKQYYKLAQVAELNNISVHQAYDHFVLGKELHVTT
jgi:hypothetical protein